MGEIKYPIKIEIPEGYWTTTTTIDTDILEDPNKYWHNKEDNEN